MNRKKNLRLSVNMFVTYESKFLQKLLVTFRKIANLHKQNKIQNYRISKYKINKNYRF